MVTHRSRTGAFLWCVLTAFVTAGSRSQAQRPQDNWYQEAAWVKTNAVAAGGLTEPYGVAIGLDGRIYVGDQGAKRIQVYWPDGTFGFGITNGFGGGLQFNQPRGMITDREGNLYVADYAANRVYVFSASGAFVRSIGDGTGSGNGQLNGAIDVAVSPEGMVYVLENGNARVSVFYPDGAFARILIGPGPLDGQLVSPASIALSDSGQLCIAQNYMAFQGNKGLPTPGIRWLKAYDTNGVFRFKLDASNNRTFQGSVYSGPSSIRIDPTGLLHVFKVVCGVAYNTVMDMSTSEVPPIWMTHDLSGEQALTHTPVKVAGMLTHSLTWPCTAIGADGTMIVCAKSTKTLHVYRYAMREQGASPRNAIPMPEVIEIKQRPQSPLVDIDYRITDMDDTVVHSEAMVFKDGVPAMRNCLRNLTWVEGTATNLGPGISANRKHRLTWNAGADWGVDLGTYRVALLAKDSRQNLLDIHYLRLKDEQGQPKMTISRSPLIQSDFLQAWWWLLAINDPEIALSSECVRGVNGVYADTVLCTNETTTAEGRAFIYERMNVREATPEEVSWARFAATTNSVEVWIPARTVGGRPGAVNEYGFDTGNWGANAWWVVAE